MPAPLFAVFLLLAAGVRPPEKRSFPACGKPKRPLESLLARLAAEGGARKINSLIIPKLRWKAAHIRRYTSHQACRHNRSGAPP